MDVHKVLARLIGEIAWIKDPEGNTMTCRGAGVDPSDFDGAHDALLLRSTSGRSRSSTPRPRNTNAATVTTISGTRSRTNTRPARSSGLRQHLIGTINPACGRAWSRKRAGRGARSSAVRAVAWGRCGLPRAAAVVAGGVGRGWAGGGWVTTGGGAGRGAGAGAGAGAGCGAGAGVGAGAVVGAATG